MQDAAKIDDYRAALEFWAAQRPLSADEQAKLDHINLQAAQLIAEARAQGVLPAITTSPSKVPSPHPAYAPRMQAVEQRRTEIRTAGITK